VKKEVITLCQEETAQDLAGKGLEQAEVCEAAVEILINVWEE